MSYMSEYIDQLKEYQRATDQVIAAKDKEIDRQVRPVYQGSEGDALPLNRRQAR